MIILVFLSVSIVLGCLFPATSVTIQLVINLHISHRALVCFSTRGTHGYMAPEVLQKGTAYDSSADWFSLGCMLFKLLRG